MNLGNEILPFKHIEHTSPYGLTSHPTSRVHDGSIQNLKWTINEEANKQLIKTQGVGSTMWKIGSTTTKLTSNSPTASKQPNKYRMPISHEF